MPLTSLPSSPNQPGWEYILSGPGRSGRSLSENNFARERKNWLSILLREVLQNALDARVDETSAVTVVFRLHQLSDEGRKFVGTLLPSAHLLRLKESLPHVHENEFQVENALVIEDFGTTGLTGSLQNPDLDGKGENWNAFWFREGEGGKENSSGNGGAGQGKITYFSTSRIRTIFSYTVRNTDEVNALFGASSFLRDYTYQGEKWRRDAYWGHGKGEGFKRTFQPVTFPGAIEEFQKHFGLERTQQRTGLSLIIPAPKVLDMQEAIRVTIAEFFVPILRGDLIVKLDGLSIDKSTVVVLADQLLSDEQALDLKTCTTSGYRRFLIEAVERSKNGPIRLAKAPIPFGPQTESVFDESDLKDMRSALANEEIVSVRFPVSVKEKDGKSTLCTFDVHLIQPFELERAEQAIIRRDLLIGDEPVGQGKFRQRARGLTLISDKTLSRLLLNAEEPTHLRWNTKLPRLGEYYKDGVSVVTNVRNAMNRLLDLLSAGNQKPDFKILSKFFSAPGTLTSNPSKGKKTKDGKLDPQVKSIPKALPRILAVDTHQNHFKVTPAAKGALAGAKLPLEVKAEFAYEGLDRDAFNEYDRFDFDLSDKSFTVEAEGCKLEEKNLNTVAFTVVDPDFEFLLQGFDKNFRLRVRLNYEEQGGAEIVDAE